MTCTAGRHGTWWAYDRWRCRCPQAVADKTRRRGPRPARVVRHDPELVAAAVEGQPVRLTKVERAAAIAALHHLPAKAVARRLAVGTTTVHAHRKAAA